MSKKIFVQKNGVRYYPSPEFLRKLPARERAAWARHLTSGNYSQAKKTLCNSNVSGMCCLGVKLHAGGVALQDLKGKALPRNVHHNKKAARLVNLFPPVGDPVIAINAAWGGRHEASYCNDNLGLSFKQIAKLIYPEAYGYEI